MAYVSVHKGEDYYKMDHKNRGLAYIFNHIHVLGEKERVGTEKDVELLTETFEGLNFEVSVFTDLTYKEVMDQLDQGL